MQEQNFKHPAAYKGEGRVKAVIARDKEEATRNEDDLERLRDSLSDLHREKRSRANELENARKYLEQIRENNAKRDGSFFGLGRYFGKKERDDEADNQKNYVRELEKGVNLKEEKIDKSIRKRSEAWKNKRRIPSVIEANEAIVANEMPDFMETDKNMARVWSRQNMIQKLAKEGYFRNAENSSDDTKFLPTADMFKDTSAALLDTILDDDQNDESRIRAEKDRVEKMMLDILPVVELITKYCDKHKIPLSEKLIQKAIVEGFNITRGSSGNDSGHVWKYLTEKRGGRVASSEIGYYDIGAFQLDRFFKRRQNIKGINRVPYVLAYATGAMANGAPADMARHTRHWLAEVIPAQGLDNMWRGEDGWQNTEEEQSLGIGYFASMRPWSRRETFEGETNRPGLIEIAQESNKLVGEIDNYLTARRRFDARRHFRGDAPIYDGTPRFPVPRLAETQ